MLDHSVFNPASPQGLAISNLFMVTVVISLVIVGLITGVLAYTTIRYRHRRGQGEPAQTFGVTKLEIAWTATPFLILCVVFGITVQTMLLSSPGQISLNTAAAHDPYRLTVIGHQWWWEVRYPSGAVTANEIHIPAGKRFVAVLESADVIHDFWVPRCGPKMDQVPGQTTYLWLECDRPGIYDGACSEFCGAGHAWMLLRVIVESPGQFAAWQRRQLRRAPSVTAGLPAQGRRLFQAYPCQSCHEIDGLAPRGTPARVNYGPNLTHVGERQTLAAGRIGNAAAHMEEWLANPALLKPGVHMPNFQLDRSQLRALTAYMESLR